MRILVCDDERDIVSALTIYLTGEGYEVLTASNGREAVELLRNQWVELVLLDVMMPVMDGIAALHELREFSNVPVILLTAKGEDIDKVLGLNVGADDYVTKPFNPVELMARVRSQLRRYTQLGGGAARAEVRRVGNIVFCDRTKRVTVDGEEISLTPTEYNILKILMEHPGEVFSPAELYRRVGHGGYIGAETNIAVHIRHLREKLEINSNEPRYLKVVWGKGYKMEE